MSTQHNSDNIFKERFADFSKEPPPGSWEEIKKHLPQSTSRRIGLRKWFWMPFSAFIPIFIAAVATLLLSQSAKNISGESALLNNIPKNQKFRKFSENVNPAEHKLISFTSSPQKNRDSKNSSVQHRTRVPDNSTSQATPPPAVYESQQGALSQNGVSGAQQQSNEPATNNNIPVQNPNASGEIILPVIENSITQEPITPSANSNNPVTESNTEIQNDRQSDRQNQINETPTGETPTDKKPLTEIKKEETPGNNNAAAKPVDYGNTSGWELALNVVPEYMFKDASGSENKWKLAYEICGTYNIKNFIIQGGFGLGFFQQTVSHNLLYNVNHLSGSFEDVTSYTWDSIAQKPLFSTETVNYYDSIQQSQKANAANKYSLLHIPLLLGYKHDVKNFTFVIKGGLQYSIMISEKNSSISSAVAGSRLIEDKSAGAAANKNGLALLLNCGVAYNINHRFGIAAEPSFRYYIKNIYGMSDTNEKPYSIGIRAGVIIKL
ncbi:MAG: hypothetical protein WCM76_00275 [Bacteroidota bacterium]